jgi:hypothetical protein
MFAVRTWLTVEAPALTWTSLSAATVMDLNPTVIQLVDQLEFPVLPRNPSASDPLNIWYIKVFQHSPLRTHPVFIHENCF